MLCIMKSPATPSDHEPNEKANPARHAIHEPGVARARVRRLKMARLMNSAKAGEPTSPTSTKQVGVIDCAACQSANYLAACRIAITWSTPTTGCAIHMVSAPSSRRPSQVVAQSSVVDVRCQSTTPTAVGIQLPSAPQHQDRRIVRCQAEWRASSPRARTTTMTIATASVR